MAKKEKPKMFEEITFTSTEEAEKELKKEKILFIVKGVGTALAVIGTIIFCVGVKKGDGDTWMGTMSTIGLLIGIVGELVACFVYKIFKYWFKFIGIMGVIIPVLGLFVGFVLGFVAAVYLPAIYALLAFKESLNNYKAAKAYLSTKQTVVVPTVVESNNSES